MILQNGKLIEKKDLIIDTDHFNYGNGIFETILYTKNRLILFDKHIQRAQTSASFFKYNFNTKDFSQDKVYEVISANNQKEKTVKIKILITKTVSYVFTEPYSPNIEQKKCFIHPEIREGIIYNHKTTNYLNNLYWFNYYKNINFDEVLFINKKFRVVEGSRNNIIALYNKNIYFVDNHENYLNGIMQQFIIENHNKLGFKKAIPKQRGFSLKFLRNCQALYLTNSLNLAQPIIQINRKKPNKKEIKFEPDYSLYEKIEELLFN